MTINDIMIRDIAEADAKERKRAEQEAAERRQAADGDECAFPWLAVCVWIAVAILALCAAFAAGMNWQSHRDLKASRDFTAWLENVERDAEARARAMSNYELLRATAKTEAVK